MVKKNNRKEKPFEINRRRQAEIALEKEWALREAKRLKTEANGSGDGSQQPQFIPIPTDIAYKVPGSYMELTETKAWEEAVGKKMEEMQNRKEKPAAIDPETGEPMLSKKQRERLEKRQRKQFNKERRRAEKEGRPIPATLEDVPGYTSKDSEGEERKDRQDLGVQNDKAGRTVDSELQPEASERTISKKEKKKRHKKAEADNRTRNEVGKSTEDTAQLDQHSGVAGEGRKRKRKDGVSKDVGAEFNTQIESGNHNGEDVRAEITKGDGQRFIVFVGNLPFSATAESIKAHFKKIEPSDIRLITHKDTEKSKGYAFLEFDRYDRMKSCLKSYHGSAFEGRKINCELTAGGGGKNEARKLKLQEKNERLKAERKRRVEHEEKEKKRRGDKAKDAEQGADVSGKPEYKAPQRNSAANGDGSDGIHPSRRSRIMG